MTNFPHSAFHLFDHLFPAPEGKFHFDSKVVGKALADHLMLSPLSVGQILEVLEATRQNLR